MIAAEIGSKMVIGFDPDRQHLDADRYLERFSGRLLRLYGQGRSMREIIAEGFEARQVRRVRKLVETNRFKSRGPEIANL